MAKRSSVLTSASLDLTGSCTIEVWAKPDATLFLKGLNFIYSKNMDYNGVTPGDTGYALATAGDPKNYSSETSSPFCVGECSVTATYPVVAGSWFHVAVVVDL